MTFRKKNYQLKKMRLNISKYPYDLFGFIIIVDYKQEVFERVVQGLQTGFHSKKVINLGWLA